jgi:hypothetical protein
LFLFSKSLVQVYSIEIYFEYFYVSIFKYFIFNSAHLNFVLRSKRQQRSCPNYVCVVSERTGRYCQPYRLVLVAALQAFQMNHYCNSKSFDDFEKIIANYLEIEKVV